MFDMEYSHVISAIIRVISHRFKAKLRSTSRIRRSKVEMLIDARKYFFSPAVIIFDSSRIKTDKIFYAKYIKHIQLLDFRSPKYHKN